MKPLKLIIKNMTSLRGSHQVDFSTVLKGEELFAITGATGAGKSTLLNCISLALYNNTYKGSLSSFDFVTQEEAQGDIEFYFSCKGKIYTALWSCKVRKKNGELMKRPSLQRHLLCDGVAIEQSPEDVLNLNFDQFSKTVILGQGEFARFLTSSFSERKLILERLSHGEELSGLSRLLRQKIKEIEFIVQGLKSKVEGALPFEKHELSHMIQRLEQEKKDLLSLKEGELNFSSLKEATQSFYNYLVKSIEADAKNKAIVKQIELHTQEEHLKSQAYERAQEKHQSLSTYIKNVTPKLQEAVKIWAQYEAINQSIKELNEQDRQLKQKLEKEQVEIDKTQENIKKVQQSLKELKIKILLQLSKEQKETISQVLKDINLLNQSVDYLSQELESLEEKKCQLQTLANQLKSKKESTLNDGDIPLLEKALETSTPMAIESDRIAKELSESKKELALLERNLESYKKEKELISSQLQLKEKLFQQVKARKDDFKLFEAINLCWEHSLEEKTCVVCQSPVQSEQNKTLKKDIYEDLSALEIEEEKLSKDLFEQQKSLTSLEEKTKFTLEQKSKVDHRIKTLLEQKKAILSFFKIKDLSFVKEAFEQKKSILKNLKSTEEQLKKTLLDLDETNTHYQRKKILREKSQQSSLEKYDIITRISPVFSEIPKLEIPSFFDSQLNIIQSYEQLLLKEEGLHKQISLQQQYRQESHLQRQGIHSHLLKKKETSQELLQKKNELLKGLGDISPQEKLKEMNDSFEKSLQEKDNLQQEYQKTLQQKKSFQGSLSSLQEYQQDLSLQLLKEKKLIQEQAKKLHSFLEKSSDEWQKICLALTKLEFFELDNDHDAKRNALDFFMQEILLPSHNKFNLIIKEKETLIISFQEKLALYRKKEKELEHYQDQLKDIQNKQTRMEQLAQVLGKDEFRNFALALIEKKLIFLANRELETLCDGRYELLQQEQSRGTDFYVLDHWASGAQRKVSTLSGGETFLVSLGLALALSEMSRGSAEIESFFIDEGFGALDQDSIEEALEVLLTLRNRGKQIGIISHIKNLTDRIPVNIHLEKSGLGTSQIEYFYN